MSNRADGVAEAVAELREAHENYLKAQADVLAFGQEAIAPLIASLNPRSGASAVEALGLLLRAEGSDDAIPALLPWIAGQSRISGEALQALRFAGNRVLPSLVVFIADAVSNNDDGAALNYLALGSRLEGDGLRAIAAIAQDLLSHPNPHIRAAGADALGWIALPEASPAKSSLQELAATDPSEPVRRACIEALSRLG